MSTAKNNGKPVLLEVRCCCEPKKLLGWLPVQYPYMTHVRYWLPEKVPFTDAHIGGEGKYIEMPLCEYAGEDLVVYRAVKSEGIPIELLRAIPAFKENKK